MPRVQADLAENHRRAVAKAFVQDVADAVATVALAKEEAWEYDLPAFDEPVATVTVGLDGTCMLMCDDGWREAMVGTLGFDNKDGERLHTVYTAATPEYGKLDVPGAVRPRAGPGQGRLPRRDLRGPGRRGEGQAGSTSTW